MVKKIKEYIDSSRREIFRISQNQISLRERIDESIGASQVYSLISNCQYLPFNQASLNFTSLATLINDIVINDRKLIMEFGSGISTIAMALLIRKNKLENVRILSIEDNLEWLQVVRKLLQAEELSEYVDLIHAPLTEVDFSLDNNKWYDPTVLLNVLNAGNRKVDCVLVDGPAAWYQQVYRSRFPALPFLHEFLNERSVVFLDDTNRKGEKEILEMWAKFDMKRIDFNSCFTGLFRGSFFNIKLP
jgi:hypothetical protein